MADLMTVDEVAAVLRVHPATVRKMIDTGELAGLDVSPSGSGRASWRIERPALDAYLDVRRAKGAASA